MRRAGSARSGVERGIIAAPFYPWVTRGVSYFITPSRLCFCQLSSPRVAPPRSEPPRVFHPASRCRQRIPIMVITVAVASSVCRRRCRSRRHCRRRCEVCLHDGGKEGRDGAITETEPQGSPQVMRSNAPGLRRRTSAADFGSCSFQNKSVNPKLTSKQIANKGHSKCA